MKRFLSIALSVVMVFSLLVGSLTVSAYEWEEGKLPADWEPPLSETAYLCRPGCE